MDVLQSDSQAQWRTQKKVATFLRFFVFLPYLDECFALISTYFCCIYVLDECFALRFTFLGCIFSFERCFALRFMSTTKNTKKVTTFLHFFVVLPYLTTLINKCFALKFMNIVKNTKKVTTFLLLCDFLLLYHI